MIINYSTYLKTIKKHIKIGMNASKRLHKKILYHQCKIEKIFIIKF